MKNNDCSYHVLEKTGEKYYKDDNKEVLFFKCMLCDETAYWEEEVYTSDLSKVSPSLL